MNCKNCDFDMSMFIKVETATECVILIRCFRCYKINEYVCDKPKYGREI